MQVHDVLSCLLETRKLAVLKSRGDATQNDGGHLQNFISRIFL